MGEALPILGCWEALLVTRSKASKGRRRSATSCWMGSPSSGARGTQNLVASPGCLEGGPRVRSPLPKDLSHTRGKPQRGESQGQRRGSEAGCG
jgi:hypothetical protein